MCIKSNPYTYLDIQRRLEHNVLSHDVNNFGKNFNLTQLGCMLCKYEMHPDGIGEDTERTRFHLQMDRWTKVNVKQYDATETNVFDEFCVLMLPNLRHYIRNLHIQSCLYTGPDLVITVLADALAPKGARPSVGTMLTKWCIFNVSLNILWCHSKWLLRFHKISWQFEAVIC